LDERGLYRRVGGWIDNELIDLDVADIRAGLQVNIKELTIR